MRVTDSRALNVLLAFFLTTALLALSFGPAYGEDVVIFDGHPLGHADPEGCPNHVRSRHYTTTAATFLFEWSHQCPLGDITYEVTIERNYDPTLLETIRRILLGSGGTEWTEQSFSGLCPSPCSQISFQVEHPWHETARYWFLFDFRKAISPEDGGGSVRVFGSEALQCASDGVKAACDGWNTTAHIPESLDDIPCMTLPTGTSINCD